MPKEKILNVRLTAQQYEKIQQDAALRNMSVSEYARQMMTTDNSGGALSVKQQIMEVLSEMSNDVNRACEFMEEEHPDICDKLEERVSKLCHTLNL